MTVMIQAGQAGKAGQGSVPPVFYANMRAGQSITASASNQVSTVKGYAGETFAIQSNTSTIKVAVAVGTDPDATSATKFWIVPTGTLPFPIYCDENDTRIAVTTLAFV